MKYLVVQDWENTHGNHAGMVHLCDMLVERYPNEYFKICKPIDSALTRKTTIFSKRLRILRNKILKSFFLNYWVKNHMSYCCPMLERLQKGDKVFLLQYCSGGASQDALARYIKKHYEGVTLYAMSHQTPSNYIKAGYDAKKILQWDSYVDKHILMGSSLANYFQKCGVNPQKISVGFHYVDNNYYKKKEEDISTPQRPKIIAIGAMQRDMKLLSDIVNRVSSVDWIICKGMKKVDHLFHGNNIKLVGFVPEDELRRLMSESDASINVMGDTVGSNVITTSLAMGLVVIASEVGSIRDYIDESCGFLCKNTVESFVQAVNEVVANPDKIVEMRKASLKKVPDLTVEKVHDWFNSL